MGRTTHTHTHTHTSTMGGPFCVIRTLRVVMQQLIHHHTRRPRPTDRPSLPISAIVVVIVVAAPLDSHCCCCVWPAPRPSIPVISVSSSSPPSIPSGLADPVAAAAGNSYDTAGEAAGELGASSFTLTVVAAALSYASLPLASVPATCTTVLPVGGITTTASSTVWGGQDARTDGHSPTRNLRTPSLRFTAPLQRARTRPAAKTEEGGGAPHSLTHSLTQSIDIHRSSALQFERNRRRINLTDRSGSHQHWTTS
eukprot:GHVU01021270.1.p1 GENE.GHVU01021270.1~~GHVU01021270.1.p1  ORF type:complete len:254 (-),score=16.07 GHVU01021270.1:1415-2176(-)